MRLAASASRKKRFNSLADSFKKCTFVQTIWPKQGLRVIILLDYEAEARVPVAE